MIVNYDYKYTARGKWFFAPNDKCERRGRRMLQFFKRRVVFPHYMYHFKKGGHVAALHAHLNNELFFKIDIQNFYYSIARMRVTRALREWGYPGANTFAMMVMRPQSRTWTKARSAYRICPVGPPGKPRSNEVGGC